jgi:hypothetical protein
MAMQANSGEMDVPKATEHMIRRYVSQSPFIDPALKSDPDSEELLNVVIEYFPPKCDELVTIEVQLPWIVGREWRTRPTSGWFPFFQRQGVLTGYAEGVVLCERTEDVENAGP